MRATYKKSKKGELPEWDLKTGMLKAGSDRIAPPGRLTYSDVHKAWTLCTSCRQGIL